MYHPISPPISLFLFSSSCHFSEERSGKFDIHWPYGGHNDHNLVLVTVSVVTVVVVVAVVFYFLVHTYK